MIQRYVYSHLSWSVAEKKKRAALAIATFQFENDTMPLTNERNLNGSKMSFYIQVLEYEYIGGYVSIIVWCSVHSSTLLSNIDIATLLTRGVIQTLNHRSVSMRDNPNTDDDDVLV